MGHRVLVADVDADRRTPLVEGLRALGHDVGEADPADADRWLAAAPPEVLFVAVGDDAAGGLALLERARRQAIGTALIALARAGDTEAITEAVRAGAHHQLTRPVAVEAASLIVERALDRSSMVPATPGPEGPVPTEYQLGRFEQIVGRHPTMQQLLGKVLQAARSRATVLIHGETGTGKELIAAAIHEASRRREGPFVRLNCAALAESVLESELFGHERGSFTGATGRRLGRFEQAMGGTLFLDEVSEIPKPLQVKLLRFLQEREFERVGGNETLRVDVRIVAASNRDLRAMVSDGSFREDLYYRLNVVRLDVPPLRARPSDILLLAEHFLRVFADQEEKSVSGFTEAARRALLDYPWPGNVRELQNALEQAVVLVMGQRIDVEDLPISAPAADVEPLRLMIPGVTLAELERYAILKTLEAVGGSPTRAARILGVSRRTIQYRLKEWGMSRSPGGEENGEDSETGDDDA